MLYKIKEKLFLSDLESAHNLNLIKKHDIKLVIRLSEDDEDPSPYDANVKFIQYEIEDWWIHKKEIIDVAKKINEMINSFDDNVLIHCNKGQSRSVSVILYHLMKNG